MKKLWWLVFGLLACLPANEVYAISAPDFPTINLEGRFTPVGSSSGTVHGTFANQYIDIVGDKLNSSGGIWFDETLDLNEDFSLEMYFAIDIPESLHMNAAPSEGWAFVMQSTSPTALAKSGGQSIGGWANHSTSVPFATGAIQDGFVIEFDTFNNEAGLSSYWFDDNATFLSNESHMAGGYPGCEESYKLEAVSHFDYQNILNHKVSRSYHDINLDLNNWHKFTISYNASTKQLIYTSYWINEEVVVNLDKNAFKNPSNVYFGFTGSNSSHWQQRSVALTKVQIGNVPVELESTVVLDGSLEVDIDNTRILNANRGNVGNIPIEELPFNDFLIENNENKKTFTYNVDARYTNSGFESLPVGAEIAIDVPDILEAESNQMTVDIGSTPMEFTLVSGFSGYAGKFKRIDNQYIFSLPELSSGDKISISLSVVVKSDPDLIIDKNIDLEKDFSATFRSDTMFVETGERDADIVVARPFYKLEALFGPKLTGDVYDSFDIAISQRKKIFQDQKFSICLGADDLNSMNVTLYASKWLNEDQYPPIFDSDYPSDHENLGAFERTLLTDDFENKDIDFRGNETLGSGIFYKVFYLVDAEGNVSSQRYLTVEILEKGIVELSEVPNFLFESINLSTIRNSVDLEGFVNIDLVRGADDSNPLLIETYGNNDLNLAVDNINGQSANWRLSAYLEEFTILRSQNTSVISATDIELHLTVSDRERIISHSKSLIHEEKDDVDGFYQTIEEAKLRIRGSAIYTPGVYQGAINWELTDSV